ncbi:MAG TPA: phosphatidylserine/phosphatidylglycerophosphate/cardiolipin synthase family protein [Candidatus Acidoferrum sp.]|jgi:cardiolipin synthase|nr:phosphatidylserine/phosphatidylglycerophosphate/cardiolipin synthase family protein [Candidatus Acidoferrum sp.]
MSAEVTGADCRWLPTGDEFFAALLAAVNAATQSVCFETYIYAAGQPGEGLREALVNARKRGVRVRVLIDAFGSYWLPAAFWEPLLSTGGEVRLFNPLALHRLGFRDHRKLVVCDDRVAFVGGFNITPEYAGDGVTRGWRDLGLRIEGPLALQLVAAFEEMFTRADFQHNRFLRLRRSSPRHPLMSSGEHLLLSGPGRGRNPIKRALLRDLADAGSVQLMVGYFLPPLRLRRQLVRLARRGGAVELILPGKSDVAVSLLAARSLYRRLLKSGVEIDEYQPQILHAKLFIIDDVVYVGSANLDQRSFNINYELMVRFRSPEVAAQAREIFRASLSHCRSISLEEWCSSRSLWQRIKARVAYFLLVRMDPYLARRQWRALRD